MLLCSGDFDLKSMLAALTNMKVILAQSCIGSDLIHSPKLNRVNTDKFSHLRKKVNILYGEETTQR